MEVYVYEMITKNVKETSLVKELKETFKLLRRQSVLFRVKSEIFLGYMISQTVTDENPDKV